MDKKKCAIILDETGKKRIVDVKWLNEGLTTVDWPPYEDVTKVKKAVIDRVEPQDTWGKFPVTFIKFKDDYHSAMAEINLKLDEITDASDDEKMRQSRGSRKKIPASPQKNPPSPKKSVKRGNEPHEKEISSPKKSKQSGTGEQSSDEDEESEFQEESVTRTMKSNIPSKLKLFEHTESNQTEKTNTNFHDIDQSPTHKNTSNPSSSRQKEDFEWKPKSAQEALFIIFCMQKKTLERMNKLDLDFRSFKKERLNNTDTVSSSRPILTETMEIRQHFPIDNEKDSQDKKKDGIKSISVIEAKLQNKKTGFFEKVIDWMSTIGGETSRANVNNILAATLTNAVADKYSFLGQGSDNLSFYNLYLNTCVFFAASKHPSKPSDDDIRTSIKLWFDRSGTRLKREKNKGTGASKKVFQPIIPDDREEDDDENGVEN